MFGEGCDGVFRVYFSSGLDSKLVSVPRRVDLESERRLYVLRLFSYLFSELTLYFLSIIIIFNSIGLCLQITIGPLFVKCIEKANKHRWFASNMTSL
jgi:hypothetical protein